MKFVDQSGVAKVQENQSGVKKDEGVARAISVSFWQTFHPLWSKLNLFQSFIDPSLSWKDIPWFKSITSSTSWVFFIASRIVNIVKSAYCT